MNEINDEIGAEMLLQRSNIRPISILNLSQLLHFCYDMHYHTRIDSISYSSHMKIFSSVCAFSVKVKLAKKLACKQLREVGVCTNLH